MRYLTIPQPVRWHGMRTPKGDPVTIHLVALVMRGVEADHSLTKDKVQRAHLAAWRDALLETNDVGDLDAKKPGTVVPIETRDYERLLVLLTSPQFPWHDGMQKIACLPLIEAVEDAAKEAPKKPEAAPPTLAEGLIMSSGHATPEQILALRESRAAAE